MAAPLLGLAKGWLPSGGHTEPDTSEPYAQGSSDPTARLLNPGAMQTLQSGRMAEQRSESCSRGRGLPPPDLCQL